MNQDGGGKKEKGHKSRTIGHDTDDNSCLMCFINAIRVNFEWFRLFNETPVNPRKCTAVLAKILFLLNQGEVMMNGLYTGGNKKPFACQKYDRWYNIYP